MVIVIFLAFWIVPEPTAFAAAVVLLGRPAESVATAITGLCKLGVFVPAHSLSPFSHPYRCNHPSQKVSGGILLQA